MPGRSYNASDYRWGQNSQEKVDDITPDHYTALFWEYDARLIWRQNPDPVIDHSVSPYNCFKGNPILNTDLLGNTSPTDVLDEKTGEATHIEDGKDQTVIVNNNDFQKVKDLGSDTKKTWTKDESTYYLNTIENAKKVDWNSDFGKVARAVYAEMSGIGTTNTDRQIVAESIVNRKESGLYGNTYSDILTKGQYNAIGTTRNENPYAYMNSLKEDKPFYYKAHESEIKANFVNALSVTYKTMNGIGTKIGNEVVSYVSPPRLSTHFDKDPYLKNITNTITGLKGISGVWNRK